MLACCLWPQLPGGVSVTDNGMLCFCSSAALDTQAVVVWLLQDLGLLCEQIEVPCQHAEVARAVLAGECMAQAGASRRWSGQHSGLHLGCGEPAEAWAQAHLSLKGVRQQPLGLMGGPAAILRTGTWWPSEHRGRGSVDDLSWPPRGPKRAGEGGQSAPSTCAVSMPLRGPAPTGDFRRCPGEAERKLGRNLRCSECGFYPG